MTPHLTPHLDETALDELLLDLATPETLTHVAACPACARHLHSARASLLGTVTPFNQASMAWSEARSNTLTRDLSTHHPRPTLTLPALASYTAAALVAASILIGAGLQHHTQVLGGPSAIMVPVSSQSEPADEIAADNAMLQAIDSELYRPVSIPAALAEDPQIHARRHAE